MPLSLIPIPRPWLHAHAHEGDEVGNGRGWYSGGTIISEQLITYASSSTIHVTTLSGYDYLGGG